MIIFPNRPDDGDDLCGMICIPEELDFDSFERPTEDEFVKMLIEIMSKPMKGGTDGEDKIRAT